MTQTTERAEHVTQTSPVRGLTTCAEHLTQERAERVTLTTPESQQQPAAVSRSLWGHLAPGNPLSLP